jgi:hypothetical protein
MATPNRTTSSRRWLENPTNSTIDLQPTFVGVMELSMNEEPAGLASVAPRARTSSDFYRIGDFTILGSQQSPQDSAQPGQIAFRWPECCGGLIACKKSVARMLGRDKYVLGIDSVLKASGAVTSAFIKSGSWPPQSVCAEVVYGV